MDFEDLIPFLIPLIIAQLVLLGYTLWHILPTIKEAAACSGSRSV